ncbi:hypothetical protein Mapa_016253 [Marchantia paleacea]|nr:hypothetical protein Mapa_016253 [Marchantia paleacea]
MMQFTEPDRAMARTVSIAVSFVLSSWVQAVRAFALVSYRLDCTALPMANLKALTFTFSSVE